MVERAFQTFKGAVKAVLPGAVVGFIHRQVSERLARRFSNKIEPIQLDGFVVFSERFSATSDQLRAQRSWEAPVVGALARELRRHGDPALLDIGANIGLVSLPLLALLPKLRVTAFEPGRYQRKLLAHNLRANRWTRRVDVHSCALGERAGAARFFSHERLDATGLDGLADTRRIPDAVHTTTVRIDTLDAWWKRSGRPVIHAAKIDTEGSELLVLRGAEEILRSSRPMLLLEISRANLMSYEFSAHDLLAWLQAHDYRLENLAGQTIHANSLDAALDKNDNFVARPGASSAP